MFLTKIQKDIQKVAEAIAELTVKDVIVFNGDYKRVAGTGNFVSMLNKPAPQNSLVQELHKTKKTIFRIKKAGNKTCENCSNKENCDELSSIGYPIFLNKKVIGSIWVVACNEYESNRIIKKEKEYKHFLKRMSEFIEGKIQNIIINEKLEIEAEMINEILNKVNDGVLVVDEKNKIKLVNEQACRILSLKKHMLIEKAFKDIIIAKKQVDFEKKDLDKLDTWMVRKNQYKIIYSIIPMQLNSRIVNRIITFRKVDDILNLAEDIKDNSIFKSLNIIGKSKAVEDIKLLTERAAETDSNLLLLGETGTGKEVFARAIHHMSNRSSRPFIAVNCASIPETLLESELFGYEKGSFTGALATGKKGKFELAHGGTLFLDEIGDMPLNLQPKILRALQENTVERLGGTSPIKIDVRIISATNKNLRQEVTNGKFREDLYYRINVIPIKLPPLRDRENDVLICAQHFLNTFCEKFKKRKLNFSKEVKEYFQIYEWPGNIRELQNVVEYAVNMCQGLEIKMKDLPIYVIDKNSNEVIDTYKLKEKMEQFEKNVIKQTLDNFGCDSAAKEKAAKQLGIGIASLYRKIKKYGV